MFTWCLIFLLTSHFCNMYFFCWFLVPPLVVVVVVVAAAAAVIGKYIFAELEQSSLTPFSVQVLSRRSVVGDINIFDISEFRNGSNSHHRTTCNPSSPSHSFIQAIKAFPKYFSIMGCYCIITVDVSCIFGILYYHFLADAQIQLKQSILTNSILQPNSLLCWTGLSPCYAGGKRRGQKQQSFLCQNYL